MQETTRRSSNRYKTKKQNQKTSTPLRYGLGKLKLTLLRKGTISRLRPPIDYALSFDGVANRVIIPHSSSLMPLTELSILMWIYPRSYTTFDVYLAKQDYGSEGYYVQQGSLEENIAFWLLTNNWNFFDVDVGSHLNVWSHIACVFKADDYMKVYRNGIEKGTTTPASGNIVANTGSLKIGNFWEGLWEDYGVDSIIDEVLIYNKALSENEIKRNMVAKTPILENLVLWLPMNEGAGDTVHDKSGQGNNGTIIGATWIRRLP